MSRIIRKLISTSNAPQPVAPYKYYNLRSKQLNFNLNWISKIFLIRNSQAVVADRTVYVSGCLGLDKSTMTLVPGGAAPEMAKALENLQAVLAAAGSGIDKVVKATVFVEDLGEFANINEEYKKGKWINE